MLKGNSVKCGLLVSVLVLVGLPACRQSGESDAGKSASTPGSSSSEVLPSGFVLATMPASARGVAESKENVQVGDDVTIRGRIGGSSAPFVEGRAAFTIVDKSLKACSDIPGDQCTQPWDYCCEPKDSLARNSATVSVVNADGATLPMSLQGVGGLDELSDVVVVGKVAQAEGNVLLIHATGVFVAN